jgi:hypothetical protein
MFGAWLADMGGSGGDQVPTELAKCIHYGKLGGDLVHTGFPDP